MGLCVGRGDGDTHTSNSPLTLAGGKHIKAACLVSCQLAPPHLFSLSFFHWCHACLPLHSLPILSALFWFVTFSLFVLIFLFNQPHVCHSPGLTRLLLLLKVIYSFFPCSLSHPPAPLSLSGPLIHRLLGQLPSSNIKR